MNSNIAGQNISRLYEKLDSDHLGEIPIGNVSIKVSSLCPRIKPADFSGSVERLYDSVAPILRLAAERNVFVNFDMEQFAYKDLTLALFRKCCEQISFPAGIALQTYLRSAENDAQNLIRWAKMQGRTITVRLIKGAYWDYETIHADEHDYDRSYRIR